jgi:hypothetical protein
MRADLELIKKFEEYYDKKILEPFIAALINLIESTGFRNYTIPKQFKRKLDILVRRWAMDFEKGLEEIFDEVEAKVYREWFKELASQLPRRFRYKRTEYVVDKQKMRILKRTFDRWIVHVSLVKRATFDIWKHYEIDGLKLSERIWKHARETAKQIEKQVMLSLQTGMSANRLRDQILATAEQQPITIPKYLQKQLKDATPEQIAKKVAKYIKKKQEFNAKRVARTEIQRAWRITYVEQSKKLPFVKGIKWNLSGSHNINDICDELATADVGLGPGVYPPNAVPFNGQPAHPQCMCNLTTVLDELEVV